MTPLYLITIGGLTVSGRELAVAAVVVLVVLGALWFLLSRGRRAR
jgi:hypothetical protein